MLKGDACTAIKMHPEYTGYIPWNNTLCEIISNSIFKQGLLTTF